MMNYKGQIVRVVTDCVPKGLVPDYYAILLYPYGEDDKVKWYAQKTKIHPGPLHSVMNSNEIYILQPERDI